MATDYILVGIANCDQVKKARQWLATHHIDYQFHDLKKDAVSTEVLSAWVKQVGWEALLKKTGTTWRNLPQADTLALNEAKAIQLMLTHYNLIKRPLLIHQQHIKMMGFKEAEWHALLS